MSKSKALTVAIVSLGCPKNLIDSEKILAHLAEGGCVVGAPAEEADVIVVNTCGFLAAAKDESLAAIAEALARKRAGKTRRVVVAGCLVNREAEKLYELAPGIDAIVGVNNREDVLAAVAGRRRVTKVDACAADVRMSDAGRFRLTPRHTAYLRISEGCSQRCSFCTIPAIRGPFRSKPPEQVLAEARELIADGAVELNIVGQDTTAYGSDHPGWSLAGLLRKLDGLDGARWIRLMYTYPRRFNAALIDALAECEHVVPYVDIPLQHVNDHILRRMGRGIGRATIEKLLGRLRGIDGMVLRTTFIVGFPGETEGQFRELLDFVKGFRFDAMGVFQFSPEPGTPAAAMADPAPDQVKAERAEVLMLAQQRIAFQKNRRLVGSRIEVLVDGLDPHGRCIGRYYGQAPEVDGACVLDKERAAGTFVRGKVRTWNGYDLAIRIGD